MDDGNHAREVTELVEEHYLLLYRFAYRLSGSAADAEDITQQVFLTVQTKLPQLRDVANTKAWLFTIARNVYFKSLRNNNHEATVSLDLVAEPTAELTEELLLDSEELQNVLDELTEEFRTPLILFYFNEFSYREIAEQLAIPIGTVMSRLARAKTHLRSRLTPARETTEINTTTAKEPTSTIAPAIT